MPDPQASTRDPKDPLIRFLNKHGYMPIVVPRGGLLPPTVYTLEDDRYVLIRSLVTLLDGHADLARKLETQPLPAADLERELQSKRGGEVSIGFLGKILAMLGLGGNPKIKAALNAGDDTRFEFEGVQIRSVEPGLVLEIVNQLPPDTLERAGLAGGKLHIAYEYLYARKVAIGAGDRIKGGFKAGADVAEVAKVGVSIEGNRTRAELASYNGKEPVAFAFKVGKLTRRAGRFDFKWQAEPGMAFAPDEDGPKPYLPRSGQVYEVKLD